MCRGNNKIGSKHEHSHLLFQKGRRARIFHTLMLRTSAVFSVLVGFGEVSCHRLGILGFLGDFEVWFF